MGERERERAERGRGERDTESVRERQRRDACHVEDFCGVVFVLYMGHNPHRYLVCRGFWWCCVCPLYGPQVTQMSGL